MSRNYKKIHTEPGRNVWWWTLNKGLKKVNIGDDVYLYGRQKYATHPESGNKTLHMVIYAPGRKEFHVWGDDVNKLLSSDNYGNNGTVNRDGNKALESKVKIYILTSILDNRENWCFDLSKIPDNGKLKVIYHNGTVKNIDFNGEFHRVHRHKYDNSGYLVWNNGNCAIDKNLSCVSEHTYMYPIGYRKN